MCADSMSATGRRSFPSAVYLIDTGARRYPQSGEHYYFRDDEGMVHGPHLFNGDVPGVETSWFGEHDQYAIYQMMDTDGKVN